MRLCSGGYNRNVHNCNTKAMSEEQFKAFLEAVKADAGLKEKLNAAANADVVVEIAKEAGFVISADELQLAQSEVSEEELEGVAGGKRQTSAQGCGGREDWYNRMQF